MVAINALAGSLTWTVDHLTSGTDAGKWQYTYLCTPATANKNRGIGNFNIQFGQQPADLTWAYLYSGNFSSNMGSATTIGTLQSINRKVTDQVDITSGPVYCDSWLDAANPSTTKVNVTTDFQGIQWIIDTTDPNGSNSVSLSLTTSLAPMWGNIYMDGYNKTTNNGYGFMRNTDYDSSTQPFSMTGLPVAGKVPVPGVADTSPPTVTISSPSASITRNGPISYTVTYADDNFNSSSLSLANITLNATGTATGNMTLSGSGTTWTVTINSIDGDGTLGISIAGGTARDASGNLAPASGPSASFAVDNTPPSVSISLPSTAATGSGPVTYTVTYADPHFDLSTLSAGDITLNKTGTANGSVSVGSLGSERTITIGSITGSGTLGISIAAGTAVDLAGNLAPASGPSSTFNVDPTPPDTSITANPANPINATGASFSFTSTKAGSSFQCRLDGGAYAACTSPASYSGLAQGSHTFSVQATDGVGNTDPTPASFSWLIDTTAPSTTASPVGGTYGTTQSVTLTCSDTGGSGCDRIYYATDGSIPTTSSSVYGSAISISSATTLRYFATDLAGNSEAVKSQIYTFDTTAPDTSIAATPTNPTNATGASFSFTSTKAGSTFQCSLDGAGFTACTSPASYSGLAQGSHTFSVQATDGVGNTDPTPAVFNWLIDTTAPSTTASPVGGTYGGTQNVTLTCGDSGGAGCGTIYYTTDGSTPSTSSGVYTSVIAISSATTLRYFATDLAGNSETVKSQTYSIDTTVLDTSITASPANPTNATGASFSFTSTKAGSTFQCSLDGASYAACTSPASYAGLAPGSHTFTVQATDSVGNTDPTPAVFSWLIDTTAPSTTASPVGGTFGTTQSVTLTCSDSGGAGCDRIYYTTDGSIPTTSSSVYSTPVDITPTATIKFFATDLAGNSESFNSQTYTGINYGDYDGDGIITVNDARLTLQLAAGIITANSQQLAVADLAPLVNGKPHPDGKIDIGDVVVILRRIVGLASW
jgi:hypothetical protein